MPDEFAAAVHEMIQAKIEQRAPQIALAHEAKPTPEVINIMAALKESMEAKGRAKVRDAVQRRMGKAPKKKRPNLRPHVRGQARVGRRIDEAHTAPTSYLGNCGRV
jgi:hypothetical protein